MAKRNRKRHKPSRPNNTFAKKAPSYILKAAGKILGLVGFGVSLIGGYLYLHPRVSVDPGFALSTGDPFTTEFNVRNENDIFSVYDLHPGCYTIYVLTDHDVRLQGLPPLPAPIIPEIDPQEDTTIGCGKWIGGIGAGAGNIRTAFIEIDISYRLAFWPSWLSDKVQRFPFKGVVDTQNGAHWTHITPSELQQVRLPLP